VPEVVVGGNRRLSYELYGADTPDPALPVIVSCHGGLLTHLDVSGAHQAAADAGVRIIAPDRPGVGRSDLSPERSVLGWADDVALLADSLGASKLAVLGWSLGGQYALAAAAGLGDRVVRTATVGGVVPLDSSADLKQLSSLDRNLLWLSDHAPPAARLLFGQIGRTARRRPEKALASLAKSVGPADKDVLAGAAGPVMVQAMADGARQPRGQVLEYRLWHKPWGFALGDITTPVRIYQGDDDHLVPMAYGERLADELPLGELVRCPGEGHFLAHTRWPEIISRLATGQEPTSASAQG
jgi:pimeloyl-ACP methyl ester carboxylesterase